MIETSYGLPLRSFLTFLQGFFWALSLSLSLSLISAINCWPYVIRISQREQLTCWADIIDCFPVSLCSSSSSMWQWFHCLVPAALFWFNPSARIDHSIFKTLLKKNSGFLSTLNWNGSMKMQRYLSLRCPRPLEVESSVAINNLVPSRQHNEGIQLYLWYKVNVTWSSIGGSCKTSEIDRYNPPVALIVQHNNYPNWIKQFYWMIPTKFL